MSALCRLSLLLALGVATEAPQTAKPVGDHDDSQHNIGAGDAAKDMDLEAWCAAKNADVGPSVSRRLTEKGSWRSDPQPALHADPIPGLSEGVPGGVFHDVLSKDECKELIDGVPREGAGYMPGERVAELYRDRKVKARYMSNDATLASVLFERLKDVLPQELDGGRLYRVNPGFRFVHYEEGGHHSTHIDGREPGAPTFDADAGGWVQSRLTLQVYLNDDFEGGEFVIVQPDANESSGNVKHIIHPRLGDAIVFYQERLTPPSAYPPYELNHEGRDVTQGEKFACRTMVDYVFPDKERAQMGNVRDDRLRREAAASLRAGCEHHHKHQVLAIGNTIIDTMLVIPEVPADGKASVQSKKTYVGGQGANAAQAMAHLGLKVSFLTRTGDDSDGAMAREKYHSLGMDPSTNIVIPGCTTSSAFVVIGSKAMTRTCLIYDEASLHADRKYSDPIVAEAISRIARGEFAAVYSDGWQTDLALPLARAAVAHGVPLVLDVEQVTDDTKVMAGLATALIADVRVIQQLAALENETEAALRSLAAQEPDRPEIPRLVIAMDGPEGSFGVRSGVQQVVHIPAIKADVRDTTGAGDSFHAGFVDALVRGLGFEDAMRFATHVGAAKCEVPGSSVSREALQSQDVVRSDCQQGV